MQLKKDKELKKSVAKVFKLTAALQVSATTAFVC